MGEELLSSKRYERWRWGGIRMRFSGGSRYLDGKGSNLPPGPNQMIDQKWNRKATALWSDGGGGKGELKRNEMWQKTRNWRISPINFFLFTPFDCLPRVQWLRAPSTRCVRVNCLKLIHELSFGVIYSPSSGRQMQCLFSISEVSALILNRIFTFIFILSSGSFFVYLIPHH